MYRLLIVSSVFVVAVTVMPFSITAPRAVVSRPTYCSLDPIAGYRTVATTYLVARTTPDTLLAGRGDVTPSSYGGHWGRGAARNVYGQVVLVDSLAGAGELTIHRALTAHGDRRIVVVPWDYDPACEPTYWGGSARWIDSGLVGFYSVKLRPLGQWAAALPTFDVFAADLDPYPHGPFYRAGYLGTSALRTRPSLDAAEMFSLFRAVPFYDGIDRSSPEALAPVRRWAADHPELATKYPADVILRQLLTPGTPR